MNPGQKIIQTNYYCIISVIMMLGFTITSSNHAVASQDGGIEISKSNRSETLGEIHTFGVYSSLAGNSRSKLYAGMQLITLDNNDINESDSTLKVFIGQSFGKNFSPFYEVGTDFYGFLTLLNNDNETHNCTDEQQCAIDFFFRIGIRIKAGKNLVVGVFHENIDFGDFHKNLSGEHRYVGSSIGFRF